MSIAQGKFSASFDLLYLDYTEHLFSNICSFANFENKTSKGKLRVTNNSLIFDFGVVVQRLQMDGHCVKSD